MGKRRGRAEPRGNLNLNEWTGETGGRVGTGTSGGKWGGVGTIGSKWEQAGTRGNEWGRVEKSGEGKSEERAGMRGNTGKGRERLGLNGAY